MNYFVIAEREIVLAFGLVGVQGAAAVNRAEALDAFNRVTGKGGAANVPVEERPKVLILTEEVSMLLEDEVIEWQKGARYPLIVEIPGINGHFILDKEIQNDARKKAQAIVEQGKKRAEEILNGVQKQILEAKSQKEKFYGEKIAKKQKDSDAALPLEKERFLVSFIGNSIDQEIEEYLRKLSEEKQIELALKVLDGKKELVAGRKFHAKVCGFDNKKAKDLVEKKLGSALLSCEAFQDSRGVAGIILESEDRSLKIRLTIEEIIGAAKDKHYKEMCVALFGGRL